MTDAEIEELAATLAQATQGDYAAIEQQIREMTANPPTPEQLAERALTMRLNARLAGSVFVPRRPVKRGVKR